MVKILRWLLDFEAIVMTVAVAIYFLTRDQMIDFFGLPDGSSHDWLIALYFTPYYVLARCIVALLKRKEVPPHTRG